MIWPDEDEERMIEAIKSANDRIADLERQLSATRAELAEARAAAGRLAQQWEANADRMAPTGKRTNMVDRHTAEILRDRAREVRAALAPVTEITSEGGENG